VKWHAQRSFDGGLGDKGLGWEVLGRECRRAEDWSITGHGKNRPDSELEHRRRWRRRAERAQRAVANQRHAYRNSTADSGPGRSAARTGKQQGDGASTGVGRRAAERHGNELGQSAGAGRGPSRGHGEQAAMGTSGALAGQGRRRGTRRS
jgi:hypothetical protein